mmetsp:Transcript_37938/g.45740  ORF Transcript_37938/g.45740 Transcript_37938/m.45740 type:complete len:254 (+) Transcript_37938:168-929(+)|eukprot:CAMPEP_0197848622 /NCGR_PEP_ID=MMETSP1438-20131217/9374_1 /TAXON_ID=1461541 /ORGANISM="Pterosperma sp., Strain CCMP1384" /LENGTH=253 /DNA_ID=CAMNT_0043460961 /DNA_START=161 /DNA_END=922 /DNA_ORIENTATION=-
MAWRYTVLLVLCALSSALGQRMMSENDNGDLPPDFQPIMPEDPEHNFPDPDDKYPEHWGKPPEIQTMDYRPLPGGYGEGSSTLAGWIQKHLNEDEKHPRMSGAELGLVANQDTLQLVEPEEEDSRFPAHWGQPPRVQSKDRRPLPGNYGVGTSTLAAWIRRNMVKDENEGHNQSQAEEPQNALEQGSTQAPSTYPSHWGQPPFAQTRDMVTLPGGYGRGSSTLKGWIQKNLDKDARNRRERNSKKTLVETMEY